MADTFEIQCFDCGKYILLHATDYGLECDGGHISINLPGAICSECMPDIAEKIPNPPGISFVRTLTAKMAAAALQSGALLRPADESALFFTKLYPVSGRVFAAAGNHIHRSGLKDTAHDLFEYVLEQTDDPGLVKLNYAAICQMDGDPERGLDLMKQIPTDTPHYAIIMGNLLKDIGEWDLAADNWRSAIKKHPDHAVAYHNLSYYLLHITKNYIEAETHQRHCCAAFPNNRRLRAYLGDALFFQGKKAEALMEYENALALSDEGSDPDQFDRTLKEMIKQCQKAKNTIKFRSEQHLLAEQNKADLLLDTANSLFVMKRYDEALDLYDQAIALVPTYYEAWQHKAEALKAGNRLEEALYCYDRALEIEPTSNVGQCMRQDLRRSLGLEDNPAEPLSDWPMEMSRQIEAEIPSMHFQHITVNGKWWCRDAVEELRGIRLAPINDWLDAQRESKNDITSHIVCGANAPERDLNLLRWYYKEYPQLKFDLYVEPANDKSP